MKILLPHSENKIEGGEDSWSEVNNEERSALIVARESIANALVDNKITNLNGSAKNIERYNEINSTLLSQLTLPSYQRYDGVMYRYLSYYTLPVNAQRRALEEITVLSPLGGVESFTELIPNYKISFSSSIPSLGNLLKYWMGFFRENQGILSKEEKYISLLPKEHQKLLPYLGIDVISVEFNHNKGHESKKVKGLLLRDLLTSNYSYQELLNLRKKYDYNITESKFAN
jgi:cytoplasmic iron level regulating protein YaaA (DUF328/UPF0246 family)